RHVEELETRALEVDHLFEVVVDDARGLDLPLRGLARIVGAGFAGGVDAALEHRDLVGAALHARGGKAGLVGPLEPQRIDEPVAEVLVQVENFAGRDFAVGLAQPNVALGAQTLCLLVVDDFVRLEPRPVVIDLNVADGDDAAVRVVVVELVGLHQHLRVGVARRRSQAGRRGSARDADPGLAESAVRQRAPLRQRRPRGETGGQHEQKESARGDGAAPAVPTHTYWASGGRCHHPSSWYNRTTNPVTTPKSTGTHAAAPGCMSSALLKSAVTFDNI